VGYADSRAYDRAQPGLIITLTTAHNGSITPGDPVSYRGMKVGEVTDVDLSPTGQQVLITTKISYKYDQFVRDNSKFWMAGGVDAKIGLLGAKVRVDSVQALWNGGIAFATPDTPGKKVKSGASFGLESKVDPAWDRWSPRL
jgi:paraquat-inducible protein B